MSELTYQKDGCDVKTSLFLRKRGSCCKTSCLHCPYGFTIKKEGFKFMALSQENFEIAKNIESLHSDKNASISSSLISGAFGKPKPKPVLTQNNMDEYLLITIKDEVCGLIKKNNIQGTEIFLDKYFQDQDISLDIVNGYL